MFLLDVSQLYTVEPMNKLSTLWDESFYVERVCTLYMGGFIVSFVIIMGGSFMSFHCKYLNQDLVFFFLITLPAIGCVYS